MNTLTKGQKWKDKRIPLFLTTLICSSLFYGSAARLSADVLVKTIGGGPIAENGPTAGYQDGNTFLESQFNGPSGLTADSLGNLYIADKTNGAIRKITVPGNNESSLTTTIIGGLNLPVSVVVDAGNALYVLTQGDGRITRYTAFGGFEKVQVTGLNFPTALALDAQTNFYVTELSGSIKRFAFTGELTFQLSGFNQPRGIAVLRNGEIAISDTLNHAIKIVNPVSSTVRTLSGGHGQGFVDGNPNVTKFNQPHNLYRTAGGSLIVADRYNHRVRLVEPNGNTTTIYGINPADPAWGTNGFPGWNDGSGLVAAARQPFGVTLVGGTLFTTEVNYHIIRMVTGFQFPAGGLDGAGGTNVVVPPTLSPNFGYFPMGQEIQVQSDVQTIFYTLDGTEPTTNSFRLDLVNNQGTIFWNNTTNDLTSLRVKAFNGTNSSVTVGGQTPPANYIGISKDVTGGSGSTLVVPVVLTVRTNIKSIIFRVEVAPNGDAPPINEAEFMALPITDNDFVSVASPAQGTESARFSVDSYSHEATRGLAVIAIGTNSHYDVRTHAVAALLRVPIPASAKENDTYKISVVQASATSDGDKKEVALVLMEPRTITVRTIPYVVGDVTPANWYDAGRFGDGRINNSDVNAVFYAVNGIRRPYTFSDAFAAMDAFPPDSSVTMGGDGEIDFQDFSVILNRALGIDPENWARLNVKDIDGRILFNFPTNLNLSSFSSSSKAERIKAAANTGNAQSDYWVRQGSIEAGTVGNARAGYPTSVPIYLKVLPGAVVRGLNFRVSVQNSEGAPKPNGIVFQPSDTLTPPFFLQNVDGLANEIICAWTMGSFNLTASSNFLGNIEFDLPNTATANDHYEVKISYASGVNDLKTSYKFESISSAVWVFRQPPAALPPISDEWKKNFFGSVSNILSEAGMDADNDGLLNWQEFQAGTNPTNPLSKLNLIRGFLSQPGVSRKVTFQWQSVPGRKYILESSKSLEGNWVPVATNVLGDGTIKEFTDNNQLNGAQFYRIKLQP